MGLGTLATLTQPCLPEVGSWQVPPRSKALPKSVPSTPATVSFCTVLCTHHRSASTPAADTAQQLPQCPWSSTVAPHPNQASLVSKLSGTSPSVHRCCCTSLEGFQKGVAACTTAATVRIVAKVFAIRGGAAMAEEAHVTKSSDPPTVLQPHHVLLRPCLCLSFRFADTLGDGESRLHRTFRTNGRSDFAGGTVRCDRGHVEGHLGRIETSRFLPSDGIELTHS